MPFHIYLCISFSIKENEKKKEKEKKKTEDSTVIVQQQTRPTSTAFEIAIDKQLWEPSDAKQFVNSAFTCPLPESQT